MTALQLAVTVRDTHKDIIAGFRAVATLDPQLDFTPLQPESEAETGTSESAAPPPRMCNVYACVAPAWPTTPCGRDLCADHSQVLYHPCVGHYQRTGLCGKSCNKNDPLFALIARILDSPIGQAASSLHAPARVIIPPITHDGEYAAEGLGRSTLDLLVQFADREWTARVPLPWIDDDVHSSHVASMHAARALTTGIPNFWEAELAGVSTWHEDTRRRLTVLFVERPLALPAPAPIEALAELYIALSKRSFVGVGSLTTEDRETVVGPLLVPGGKLSVFNTAAEAHIARLDHLLTEIGTQPPGSALERTTRFCFALEARQLVRKCDEMQQSSETYLRHADLAANLTWTEAGLSVGGWEYATTAPRLEAFALPRALLDPSYATSNALTPTERALGKALYDRGARRLAAAAVKSRKYHRLHDLYSCKAPTAMDIKLFREAFGLRNPPPCLMTFRKEMLRTYAYQDELRYFVGGLFGLESNWDRRDVAYGKALAREMKWIVEELDIASRPRDAVGKRLLELADALDSVWCDVLTQLERLEYGA